MKKLTIGAISALCAAVAFGDVVSSDVVGYASSDARSGFKALGAQFVAVSAAGIDLTEIKVTGYNPEDGTEGDVTVQGLDASGMGTGTYFYYDVPGELTGWLDSNDELVEAGSVVLAPGEGLWVSAPSTAFGLQTAGKVPASGISVTLRSGFKLASNNTPVAVDLNDIGVSGYNLEDGTEGDVTVQGLDASGMGTGTYFYYDVPGELTGWLDSSDELVEDGDVMIGAGEALWVSAPNTSFSLVIPGVTL